MQGIDIVAVQIGRPPRGTVTVAASCPHGLPLAVRTSPRLDDGEPFPTRFWLTCPAAVRAASAQESAGRMRALNEQLAADASLAGAYRRAHEAYIAERDRDGALDREVSAGGMPNRVKCLHALLAHEYADANPVGAIVRREIEPLDCPGPCVIDVDGRAEAAPGHTHLRG